MEAAGRDGVALMASKNKRDAQQAWDAFLASMPESEKLSQECRQREDGTWMWPCPRCGKPGEVPQSEAALTMYGGGPTVFLCLPCFAMWLDTLGLPEPTFNLCVLGREMDKPDDRCELVGLDGTPIAPVGKT